MKWALANCGAAVAAMAALISPAAEAASPVFVTGIQATVPDPNGKVPAFNAVPGAGIETWSNGVAQAVLTGGQYYEYCISVASAKAKGTGSIVYQIVHGHTVVQSDTVIDTFPIGSQGVWYFCAGYHQLPASPGPANLVATLTYTPKNGGSPQQASLSVPVLLQ
jgi:hypothetical protein